MGEGIPWRVWVSDKHTTLIPLGPFPDISTTINSHQASRCCVHLLRFLRFPAFPAFFAFLFTRNGYARCKYLPSIYLSSLLFLPHISAILNDTSFNPRPLITIPTLAYALVQMVTLTQLCGLKAIGEDIYEVWSARVRNICYLALLPSLKMVKPLSPLKES